ncbi:hypothetical protein [Kushneria phosphatilytica]|uniref:Uncharacterized protein n=1 Tax=Kushneria phosphatilytica TaxID=657387 RepID=A0A1S1P2H9_9GAMM|nr:hypothetical protein [Kushneria phosphatilytica]OHV12980.1 hypothetical protein BH688_02975 [Kushneria phosphatilytica]QEL10850.1 hypothetical protein FY550_06740 [Kushneria phosphatilytica]
MNLYCFAVLFERHYGNQLQTKLSSGCTTGTDPEQVKGWVFSNAEKEGELGEWAIRNLQVTQIGDRATAIAFQEWKARQEGA